MTPGDASLDRLRIDRSSAPPARSWGWLVGLLCLLLIAGLGLGFWAWRPATLAVRTFTVPQAAASGDKTLLNASGYVTARRKATISSKITGKVIEILIEEGMKVEQGQILARIDAANIKSSYQLAEAQLASARKGLDETAANATQAEREFQRATQLSNQQFISKSELDRAEALAKSLAARLERQRADVTVAEREVAIWQQQLDDTIILAPFAGVVVSKDAQPGEIVSPVSAGGGFTRTGICTIVDMASLEVEVDVNESYINRVKAGLPAEATLDSYPEWHIPAKVIAIIPTADRQKATVRVRIAFEQLDPRILPDMSVKVAFRDAADSPSHPAPVPNVPRAAIVEQNGQSFAWVVQAGRAERRAVSLGPSNGDQVPVTAGLHPGETIIISPPSALAEGAPVSLSNP